MSNLAELAPTQGVQDLADLEALPEDTAEGEMSLTDIYKHLSIHEDIILIVDKLDELRIRKGLSAIKAKETAKLKGAGIATDGITLEFATHKPVEGMTEDQVKLQVFFKKPMAVKVHKIILPTADLL